MGDKMTNLKNELKIPPEDTQLQEEWKIRIRKEGRKGLTIASIKQGTWLTKDLWSKWSWKEVLSKVGINWQKFMEAWSYCSHNFVYWAKDNFSWQSAMNRLIEELELMQK